MCKLKTPYYVGKKKLMRQRTKMIQAMYGSPAAYAKSFGLSEHWTEQWYDVCCKITQSITPETWTEMEEQHRRLIIEEYIG